MARPTRPEVAFVSAVTALSCNGAQHPAPQESVPVSSVVMVPAASTTEIGDASVVEAPEDRGNARADALRANGTWNRFKVLWQKIDEVEPKAGAGMPGDGAYAGSIDAARGQLFSEEADGLLRKLEEDGLLSKAEARFLRHTTNLRIQNMVRGFMHLMVMHRMPPPYTNDKAASVERLERKIDKLLSLRKEGKIGSNEFRLSTEQVQREAITLYVLSSLGERFGRIAGLPTDEGEAMLTHLERHVAEAKQDGGLDEQLVRLVEEARTLVPAIRHLLAALEESREGQ